MDEDRLHVVFGTGQVGSALAVHLASLGMAVRAVSRHRPPALDGVDWRLADVWLESEDAVSTTSAPGAQKNSSTVRNPGARP